MDINNFRHKIQIRVRTFEVDSQGIVHNANYLKYFEIGRVEYRREYGYSINKNGIFNDGLKVVVVRNEINYRGSSYVDDVINLYTRIAWIKNSSFCFEQLITNSDNNLICDGLGILVNLNNVTNLPEKLNEKFINEIREFESNLKLIL